MGIFRPPGLVSRRSRSSSCGFTLTEVIVAIVIAFVVAIVLMPAFSRRSHGGGRQIKDSTQIRGIHQGMILWAQNNNDRYPLPSEVDKNDHTVASNGDPESKDTTANIMSMLIFNGFFSPEHCVSPAESNGNIKIFDGYQYTDPEAAAGADKKLALWDPAFSADFTDEVTGGHFSYGHAIPNGPARSKVWSNTFQATEAILGNRGPEVSTVTNGRKRDVTAKYRIPSSNTLLIHGGRTTWEGYIAFNDNHVNFETDVFTKDNGVGYADAEGNVWDDCLFFDEAADVKGTNNFLGMFIGAGKTSSEFKPIWD